MLRALLTWQDIGTRIGRPLSSARRTCRPTQQHAVQLSGSVSWLILPNNCLAASVGLRCRTMPGDSGAAQDVTAKADKYCRCRTVHLVVCSSLQSLRDIDSCSSQNATHGLAALAAERGRYHTGGGVEKPLADAWAPPARSVSDGAPLLAANTLSGTRCGGSTARRAALLMNRVGAGAIIALNRNG